MGREYPWLALCAPLTALQARGDTETPERLLRAHKAHERPRKEVPMRAHTQARGVKR